MRNRPTKRELAASGLGRCPRCGKTLPLTDFPLYRSGPKVGLPSGYCRPCMREYDSTPERKAKVREREARRTLARRAGRPAIVNNKTLAESGLRRCSECKRVLPLTDFYPGSPKSKKGWTYCRSCEGERGRRRREANPGLSTKVARRLRYGILPDQYEQLVAAQGGFCAICGEVSSVKRRDGRPRQLDLDHDHSTGLVRGLLCVRCNRGIGLLDDDPALLQAAALYLQRAQGLNQTL